MLTTALIDAMLDAGLMREQMAVIVKAAIVGNDEKTAGKAERVRAGNAERQRKFKRLRKGNADNNDNALAALPPSPSPDGPSPSPAPLPHPLNPPTPATGTIGVADPVDVAKPNPIPVKPVVIAKPKPISATDDQRVRFWAAYPSRGQAGNPKKPAIEKFDRLVRDGTDPEMVIEAVGRFDAIERAAGRWGTEKVAQATTWLNQHRWEGYAAPEPAGTPDAGGMVHLMQDTPEWDAWRVFKGGRPMQTDAKGGWRFPSRWPPGHNAKREELAPLPLEDDPFGDDVSP